MSPAPKPDARKKTASGRAAPAPGQKSGQAKRPLSMKITKNTYVFDVKKKFSVSRKFKPRPAQEGIGKLMSAFPIGGGAHPRKPGEPAKPSGMAPAQEKPAATSRPIYDSDIARSFSKKSGKAPNPLLGMAGKMLGIFFVLLLLGAMALLLILPPSLPEQPVQQNATAPVFTAQFPDMGVATYGSENDETHTVYTQGNYSSANLDYALLSLRVYDQPIPSQIFVLGGARSRADSYPIFRKELEKYLGQEGFSVSDLNPAYLDRLPSNSVLIVPTGYMPGSLLGYSDSNFTYDTLIDRGVVVVYIGLRFDRFYLDDKGTILQTDKSVADRLGLRFQQVGTDYTPAEKNGTSLFDPTYELASTKRPAKVLFGAVSVLEGSNGGAFLALPQTLDTGWSSDGSLAARDVANIVSQFVWLTPVASAYQTIGLNSSGSSGQFFVYTSPYKNEGQYARFVSTATSNSTSEKIGYGKNLVVWKRQNGELFSRDGVEVLSSYITDQPVRLSADFRDPAGGSKILYLQTLENGDLVRTPVALSRDPINLGSLFPFDYRPDLEPGTYLLRIVDNTGNIYAKSVLEVPGINISVDKKDFSRGSFLFSVNAGGAQKVRFASASATMNGENEKIYTQTDQIDYSTGPLDPGNYTFSITVGPRQGRGITKDVTLTYVVSKAFWDDPLFLLLAGLAAVVFGAGFFLRIPDKELFGLDIPDFPPIANIKIPVRKDTVVNIFRQVNKDYSWEYMPLKLSEIKNAFRKLSHNGKPIIIGDYNLERVLDKIEKSGLAFEKYGFYGLNEWIEASGHSAHYLCMFRQLRDIFVNSAVRFSPMLESDDYDVKFVAGQEVYVHIYDSSSDVAAKAFNTAPLGLTIIVFEREIDKDRFFSSLSSTDPARVSLKMEIYQGRLKLVTVAKFPDFIKEIKPT